jgi:hypothetical protein
MTYLAKSLTLIIEQYTPPKYSLLKVATSYFDMGWMGVGGSSNPALRPNLNQHC